IATAVEAEPRLTALVTRVVATL
ncbi:MAG: hypothetical protein ACWGSQ_10885, partial [Longimicrobiales bacterium]